MRKSQIEEIQQMVLVILGFILFTLPGFISREVYGFLNYIPYMIMFFTFYWIVRDLLNLPKKGNKSYD
jgi:hypothetical protein